MNIGSVRSLFTLFSGETDFDTYGPLISLAVSETEKMLRPDADPDDKRLEFLCAAIANNRLCQLNSARDRSKYTYAGKMTDTAINSVLSFSENLLKSYLGLCSDLITPTDFVFTGV